MNARQRILIQNASRLSRIDDESIHLVVTSPPYPMIEMWDDVFSRQNAKVAECLAAGNGAEAFENMHRELDKVWAECIRTLRPGGIVCINVGDATRTVDQSFALYNNHSRITSFFIGRGMTNLPGVIWRKPTNAPNKFMGSGMLPAGAYVTLGHEHILIFRKGDKRVYSAEEAEKRKQSAYFWEERNAWFSDVWEIKGTPQKMDNGQARERTAAFPFEIAYRLINMFSIEGDHVLDPFLGSGVAMWAAAAAARNGIGVEIDENMRPALAQRGKMFTTEEINDLLYRRLKAHVEFVRRKELEKGAGYFKYYNRCHQFPVMTKQEREIFIKYATAASFDEASMTLEVVYDQKPAAGFADSAFLNK